MQRRAACTPQATDDRLERLLLPEPKMQVLYLFHVSRAELKIALPTLRPHTVYLCRNACEIRGHVSAVPTGVERGPAVMAEAARAYVEQTRLFNGQPSTAVMAISCHALTPLA
jgi:hypothetical protein